MTQRRSSNAQLFLETLEPRIAPAGLSDSDFKAAPVGSSILLKAGEGLSTADTGGSYLLYVEKGQAVVFTTDLNANNKVDFNEITGIAAGDGLKFTSFVDINGDVATNLTPNGRLTDSDGDASNGYDGKIVLNSRIESIVLRSLVDADLNLDIPGNTVQNRLAKSTYSINGNIYAGGGIGLTDTFGVQIDTSGFAQQAIKYGATQTIAGEGTPIPAVGFIFTGSATSGEYFSFGTSPIFGDGPTASLRGQLAAFLPAASQAGGDVIGIRADTGGDSFEPAVYHFGGIKTGDGGFGARGGNISSIQIEGDIGGLLLQTGRGGDGLTGGNGGSITGLTINNSVNSAVQIVTGDGGAGLIGAAGRAGNVQFEGTAELMGRVSVGLGKGGDALGNGGAGTSLDNMSFVDVRPGTYLPAGIVTTWRMAGDIGDAAPIFGPGNVVTGYSTRNFDFDRDGFYDAVMLTDVPDQLVVAFGSRDPATAGTFDPTRSIYLPSMSYAAATERTSAAVVLDANGDGLPDIVSGQSTGDGYNGIITYLNRGFDAVSGTWLGFATPRYSPLPDWNLFPADLANLGNTPSAIINLVAGDFDRDDIMDLGVMSMARTSNTTAPPYFAVLTVMSGLKGSDGVADGFFAADYGKGAGTIATKSPAVSFGRSSEANFSFVMRATASEAGNADSDLIGIVSRGGETGPSVTATVDRGRSLGIFSIDPATSALSGALSVLQYTERVLDGNPRTWVGYGTTFDVRAADFLFLDVNNDGAFDAVAVGTPTGDRAPSYLVAATLQGTAAGAIAQTAQPDPGGIAYPGGVTPGGLYFGIALSESRDPAVASVLNNDREDVIVLRMVAGDFDNDPTTANFALSAIDLVSVNDPPVTQARLFTVAGFGQYNGEFNVTGPTSTYTRVGEEAFRDSFFGYYSQAPLLSVGQTNELAPNDIFWGLVSPAANPFLLWFPLAASNLSLSAGGGGWSLLGIGGAGGSIGSGVLNADELAAWAGGNSAARPGTVNAWGQVSQIFRSGFGGFGLLGGGRSGDVTGLAALSLSNYFPPEILVSSQNAGSSLFGAGGAAGAISQFSLRTGNGGVLVLGGGLSTPKVEITGGNGGTGQTGGPGGAVIGRSDAFFEDTNTSELTVTGGLGGYGMSKGGIGGGIINVVSLFEDGGNVAFTGGAGGTSASGAGGAGGSVTVRPSPLLNELNGQLSLEAGAGGDGLTGGAAGSIKGFISSPTGSNNPLTLRAVAGDGGASVDGVGGSGGGIADFSVTTSSAAGIAIVAGGRGGLSSAGIGGAGGELRNVAFTSEAGSAVGLAGAGGDGLRGGGTGGAIVASRFNAGGLTDARVVAMAGRGGDAYGVSAATVQAENKPTGYSPLYQRLLFALGSANGLGGNGGAISNFTQPQALKTSVDLVAGNGGDTISYGLISDRKTGVGRGGSMTNINLANDAGLMDSNIPIRSYAADFAQQLRDGLVPSITPQTGNVGVVVGAAGRVRNDLPVSGGVTGSVNGFKAQNIMSMVAGSVDRMVAITAVSGLQLQNGGTTVGAEKNVYIDPNNGAIDALTPPRRYATTYWAPADSSGIYSFAPGGLSGGVLLDGAVLARAYSGPASNRVFNG